MTLQADMLLTTVADELQFYPDQLLVQGIRLVLERQLRLIKTEIFEITGRYGVTDVAEMDTQYQTGTLDEASSWRDFQQLDHLEYKRDQLNKLIAQ